MSTTSLAEALKEAGLKPTKAATASTLQNKHETVTISRGQKFVLIFGCPKSQIPDGLQVIEVCGGGTAWTREQTAPLEAKRLANVKVDLQGLLCRMSVDSINISSNGPWCQVYVNCTTDEGKNPGFYEKGGRYEQFVQKALSNTWGAATVRYTEGKTSLVLREIVNVYRETTIHFTLK